MDSRTEQTGITYVGVDGRTYGPYCLACAERLEEDGEAPGGQDTRIGTEPHMASDGPFRCVECDDLITEA